MSDLPVTAGDLSGVHHNIRLYVKATLVLHLEEEIKLFLKGQTINRSSSQMCQKTLESSSRNMIYF